MRKAPARWAAHNIAGGRGSLQLREHHDGCHHQRRSNACHWGLEMPKKINVIKKIGVKSDLRVGRCVQIRRGSCEAVEREIFTRPAIFKDFFILTAISVRTLYLCSCKLGSWRVGEARESYQISVLLHSLVSIAIQGNWFWSPGSQSANGTKKYMKMVSTG